VITSGDEIWRQRLWVWLPALIFFVVNLAVFGVYRLRFAGDVQSLERAFEESRRSLAEVNAQRGKLERLIRQTSVNHQRIVDLYERRFSTRRRRLTGVTAEIKQLAAQAGLKPLALNYPEEEIEDFGLVKRSFSFSVEGDYLELRKFLNLLELSDSFLTLEEINLSGGGDGPELRINLTLSTLFAAESPAEDAVPEVS
jgi:Tfp pilus assembly protein PilO